MCACRPVVSHPAKHNSAGTSKAQHTTRQASQNSKSPDSCFHNKGNNKVTLKHFQEWMRGPPMLCGADEAPSNLEQKSAKDKEEEEEMEEEEEEEEMEEPK